MKIKIFHKGNEQEIWYMDNGMNVYLSSRDMEDNIPEKDIVIDIEMTEEEYANRRIRDNNLRLSISE